MCTAGFSSLGGAQEGEEVAGAGRKSAAAAGVFAYLLPARKGPAGSGVCAWRWQLCA